MTADDVLGAIETQVALLMRIGETTRRSTGGRAHRALDRAAYIILRRLQSDGPLNVSALADALMLDGSTVTRQLTTLEKDGLIERRRDPADGRGTVVEATPKGLTQVEAVREARRILYGQALSDYTPAEQEELASTLERFTAVLENFARSSR
jgi:DNA-binding MarR family transcriptional regulator